MPAKSQQSECCFLLAGDRGEDLHCRVRRSARRTLALHVREAQLQVRAPREVPQADIEAFVARHRQWIERKLARQRRQIAEKLRVSDGAPVYYKGRECRLLFVEQSRSAVRVEGRRLCIAGPRLDEHKAARLLADWLRRQARAYLPQRSRALAHHLGVSDRLRDVVFRKTRSKWGHCTADGRIQYNWLIMLAPDAVIDYMICHEVCHLVHMNHSRVYWQLVADLCPDYRRYIDWLKTHEHRLWF